MFTGLVETKGILKNFERRGDDARLVVEVAADYPTQIGDSVAVNGCCLTVVSNAGRNLAFDLSRETLEKTIFGGMQPGTPQSGSFEVNLERALRVGDRLGGHMVQGHVDGLGILTRRQDFSGRSELSFTLPKSARLFVIPKGSIALNGVSLTINSLDDSGLTAQAQFEIGITLIPHTLAMTTFGNLRTGQSINYELDMLAKYAVQASLGHYKP